MSCSSTKICSSVTLEPRYGKLISSHSTFYLRSLAKRKISSSAVQSVGGQHARSPKTDPLKKSDTHLNHTWITGYYSMASSNLLLLLYTHTTHTLATFTHTHTAAASAQVSAEKNKSQLVNGERLARHDAFCFATISQREVKRQPTNTNLFVSSDFFCCRRHTVQSRPHNNKQNTTHNFLINQKMQQHTHSNTHTTTEHRSRL
jgi:hypothetical protein